MMNKETRFREAVAENGKKILGICTRYIPDEDDRRDTYQEILIRIWNNLGTWRGESLLSTWIYRIAVNTCLVHLRNEKRRIRNIDDARDPETVRIADVPQEEQQGPDEKKLKFFRDYLESLKPMDRMLVSLYLEEISTKEMAEITGLSESNVRVRIHRIKEQIKTRWEEQYGAG